MEDNLEKGAPAEDPIRAKVNEWFPPFRGLVERRDTSRKDVDGTLMRTKVVPFSLDGVGMFKVSMDLARNILDNDPGLKVKVAGLLSDETTGDKISAWEEKAEANLFSVGVGSSVLPYSRGAQFYTQLQLPTGEIFSSEFNEMDHFLDNVQTGFTTGLEWVSEGGERTIVVLPEIQNILDKVNLRVVEKNRT